MGSPTPSRCESAALMESGTTWSLFGAPIHFVSSGEHARTAVRMHRRAAAGRTFSAGQSPTEYQVKAAYLFNFLKFVEWPDDPAADPHGKWVIGFIGDSPISDELTRLVQGK